MTSGIEAANRVLKEANDAVDQELRREAREDMEARVEDWKNHQIDQFGDLLLHGHFPVVNGKSDGQKEVRTKSSKRFQFSFSSDSKRKAQESRQSEPSSPERKSDSNQWEFVSSPQSPEKFSGGYDQRQDSPVDIEDRALDRFLPNMIFHQLQGYDRETGSPLLAKQYADMTGITAPVYTQYTIYLFERILLCCKEVNPNKSKDKYMGGNQKDKKDKSRGKEPNKNAKLQLKGRIFMTNVTEVLSLAKPSNFPGPLYRNFANPPRLLHSTDLLEG